MKLSIASHLAELRSRIIQILIFYIFACFSCWYFKDQIIEIIISPLSASIAANRQIIYTGVTEAFFTYIKLTLTSAFLLSLPVFAWHIYFFVEPGLIGFEKKILKIIILPFIFLSMGSVLFVYKYVMPRVFEFFLNFEKQNISIPIIFQARISEYIDFVIEISLGFAVASLLPLVIIILNLLGVISLDNLKRGRKFAILIIFILAAILTPPDIASQILLAVPMMMLYEFVIIICSFVKNKG